MKNKAFTLLELIIVTAILSIVLGFAVISFSPNNELVEKRKAVDNFLIHLNYSQAFALAENKYTFFVLKPSEEYYKFYSSDLSSGEKTQEDLFLESLGHERIDISNNFQSIEFTDSENLDSLEIIFTPWGTNLNQDAVYISLDEMRINIEGITGYVF